MNFDKFKQPAARATREAGAIASGTIAVGTANNPAYIQELVTTYKDAVGIDPILGFGEQIGSIAANHPNPTVAVFGLAAMQLALSRGRLFPHLSKTNSIGKKIGTTLRPNASLRSRLEEARDVDTSNLEAADGVSIAIKDSIHEADLAAGVKVIGSPKGDTIPTDSTTSESFESGNSDLRNHI